MNKFILSIAGVSCLILSGCNSMDSRANKTDLGEGQTKHGLTQQAVDNSESNPELKKYSGSYNLGSRPGTAEYTYLEGEDGQRIFHGYFSFKNERGWYPMTVSGQFKNNRQVGQWVWCGNFSGIWNDPDWPADAVLKMNFNDDGYLDGPVTLTHRKQGRLSGESLTVVFDPQNHTVSSSNCHENGTFRNGVFVGPYECKIPGCGGAKGTYNKEGIPVGKWVFDERYYNYYVVFDNDGEMIQYYKVNPQTGDKTNLDQDSFERNWDSYSSKMGCVPNLFLRTGDFLLRDSKELNEKILTKPNN